ncbi:MAG: cell envelope integrity protein TolA [Thermodesulfobacteriota bacterium]
MENFFTQTPKALKKIIYISIAAHIIVLAALVLYMGGARKKVFFTPVQTVSLVEPVKRPVKTKAKKVRTRKAAKKKAVKKPVIKKKAAKTKKASVAVKKAKKAAKTNEKELSTAISKIREKVRVSEEQKMIASRIEAIKEREAAEERARRLEKIRGSIKAAPPPQPRAASSTGLRTESLEIKYKAYFSQIRDKVQHNWIVPESFDDEKVSVIVSIRIGRDGKLITSWVEKGSGNRHFDDSLLKAVKKASPFPPLPQDYTEDILETGLRFCPRCE